VIDAVRTLFMWMTRKYSVAAKVNAPPGFIKELPLGTKFLS
jgi:hypothetical protein